MPKISRLGWGKIEIAHKVKLYKKRMGNFVITSEILLKATLSVKNGAQLVRLFYWKRGDFDEERKKMYRDIML